MNKIIRNKIDVIREYRGDEYASVFESAVNLYPSFKSRFLGVGIQFVNSPGFMYQGSQSLDESLITIGKPILVDGVSPFIFERMKMRFGVAEELTRDERVGGYVLSVISFAHELGHNLQDEPKEFRRFFRSEPYPDTQVGVDVSTLSTRENYEAYVNQPDEINADYIARTILADTVFGNEMLGIEQPKESTYDWQTWADKHLFNA